MADFKYVRLKGYKERYDLARTWRAMRRENPAAARMVWRETRRIEAALMREYEDAIFNEGNVTILDGIADLGLPGIRVTRPRR